MLTGTSASSKSEKDDPAVVELKLARVSDLLQLDDMWDILGECLTELAKTPDHHAVLVLQPAVEAFFIVHAGNKLLSFAQFIVSPVSMFMGGGGYYDSVVVTSVVSALTSSFI